MSNSDNSKNFIPRITQLDALFLDNEAYSLVKTQLLNVVRYIGQNFLTKFEPEIDGILQYIILKYTVQKARSSVGQQLLQIKYSDSVAAKKLQQYVLLMVFGKWARSRSTDVTSSLTKNETIKLQVSKLFNLIEILYRIIELLNLLVFLYQGKYPSVLHRIFSLNQVPTSPGIARKISYSYFTRELLWHGFAELLAFVLPLINVQYFHNVVKKFLPSSSGDNSVDDDAKVDFVAETTCVVCNNHPILPQSFGCSHLACYYCIHSSYVEDPAFSCPLCGYQIENKVQIVPAFVG